MAKYYGTLSAYKQNHDAEARRCSESRIEATARTWHLGGRMWCCTPHALTERGAHVLRFELTPGTQRDFANILVAEYAFTPEGLLLPNEPWQRPSPEDIALRWNAGVLARMQEVRG